MSPEIWGHHHFFHCWEPLSALSSVSPFQTWTNVSRGWPSVLTAASTPRDPLSVCATQAMSWVPMAGSATVSRQ